ncbi:MAG TPA: hypothetical protein VKA55_02475 [Gammaproteobacteria bacterium]|nr:hypothetical protein [Gammaproteobacteria bacterium]
MGLWKRLFGGGVEVLLIDEEGHHRHKTLAPERIEQLRAEGQRLVRLDRVPVHVLDAMSGPSQTEWVVGRDVTRGVVESHADPDTGALYAVVFYEGAEPRDTKITSRARWEELAQQVG